MYGRHSPVTLTDVRKHLATAKSKKKKERYTQYSFCDATFWTPLRTLVTFLAPYRDATNIVQSDASNLNDVHQQFSRLMRHADALVFPHPYAPLRSPLLKIIKVEWETHVNKNVVIMCAHLSLNPSYKRFSDKEKDDAQQWFYGWGGDYVKEYGLSDRQGEESVSVAIMRQYGAFSSRSDVFVKFDQRHQLFEKDHHNIQAEKGQKSTRYDVRLTWTSFTNTAPELCLLAIALLSITASEAAVERTFSRQRLVHSKLRNRLSDDTVRMQMFFSFNTRVLEQPHRHHGPSCKELEVEEVDKGTELSTEWQAEISESESEEEEEEEEEEEKEDEEEEEEEKREDGREEVKEMEDMEEEEKKRVEVKEDEGMMEEGSRLEGNKGEKPTKNLQEFITDYVTMHRITSGYRWNTDKENALQEALVSEGMSDLVSNVKVKIRKYTGDNSVA